VRNASNSDPLRVSASVLAAVVAWAAFAAPASGHVLFRFPVREPGMIWADMVLHVDHDPAVEGQGNVFCLASNCTEDFPYCYDEHRGTDFILDGGFDAMDKGVAEVVAAAGGTVIAAVDGNYDRCHADLATQEVTCDGNPIRPNYVGVRHADGNASYYYHLKKGSVAVAVGDVVACGDRLGLVGSSGISSMPHVHFQVEDPQGAIIDPFPGACGTSEEWWVVEDAGNGLPGPWCEGEAIPPEPVAETAPEPSPEPVPEPVPETLPDAGPVDLGGDDLSPADATPQDSPPADEGADARVFDTAADLPVALDPGPRDARTDLRGIVGGSGGFGCAAGAVSGGRIPVLLPFLFALARLAVRRRRAR